MAAAQEQPDRFRLRLFVDSLDETPAPSEGLHIGRIDKSAVEQALDVQKPSMWNKTFKPAETTKEDYTRGRKVLFLVCGPDP
jgi:cytochrome-b5 reductase